MGVVFVRTLVLYLVIIVALRLMGKRQIGELQPSELVVTILISELSTIPLQSPSIPLINGLVPIFALVGCELLLSFITLRSVRFRDLFTGKPSILIQNGVINQKEMRKQRFTVDDLLEELRLKNINDIADVDYAIVETGGSLSVITKPEAQQPTLRDLDMQRPRAGLYRVLVKDGVLCKSVVHAFGKDEPWVRRELAKNGVDSVRAVFMMCMNDRGDVSIVLKEDTQR